MFDTIEFPNENEEAVLSFSIPPNATSAKAVRKVKISFDAVAQGMDSG
jgi:hypothetical protein